MKYLFVFFLSFVSLIAFESGIGVRTLHYYDINRYRPVTVEVWYPTSDKGKKDTQQWHLIWEYHDEIRNASIETSLSPYPLILFSHGNEGDRRDRSWLAEKLVREGFIVASIDHYYNTWDNNSPTFHLQPWDRPLDISFALSELLEDKFLEEHIDQTKIGFSGFSLGGTTGIWLAGGVIRDPSVPTDEKNQLPQQIKEQLVNVIDMKKARASYHDARIKSYFLMSPAAWEFSYDSLRKINSPFHVATNINDNLVSFEENGAVLYDQIPETELTLLHGEEGHFVYLNQVTDYGTTLLPPCLYEDHPSVDRKYVHKLVGEKAIEFFKKSLN